LLSAYNRAQDRETEENDYNQFRSMLNSQFYRDPLSTVSNQALLKGVKKGHADEIDAVQNRMVAGGGTMENALAARQASNEGLDKVQTQLLLGEDARRDRINQQILALDQQHSMNVRNSYRQAAQDWQQWGAQTAGAMLAYGSTGLLGNYGDVADAATEANTVNDVTAGSGFKFGELAPPRKQSNLGGLTKA